MIALRGASSSFFSRSSGGWSEAVASLHLGEAEGREGEIAQAINYIKNRKIPANMIAKALRRRRDGEDSDALELVQGLAKWLASSLAAAGAGALIGILLRLTVELVKKYGPYVALSIIAMLLYNYFTQR